MSSNRKTAIFSVYFPGFCQCYLLASAGLASPSGVLLGHIQGCLVSILYYLPGFFILIARSKNADIANHSSRAGRLPVLLHLPACEHRQLKCYY